MPTITFNNADAFAMNSGNFVTAAAVSGGASGAAEAAAGAAPATANSFSPDNPYPKSRGDMIRSKDWNDVVNELIRLGQTKVSKLGDTISGPLSVSGATTFNASVNISTSLSFGAQTRQMINLWNTVYGIGVQAGTQYFRTDGNFAWFRDGTHSTSTFDPGSGGVVQMVIRSDRLGIGTTDPQGTLDVHGSIMAGTSDMYFTDTQHNHTGNGNKDGWAAIENSKDYGALMILGRSGTQRKRYVRLWDFLQVNGSLEVTENAFKTGGGAWDTISDGSLKKNIQPLEGALERLMQLRGVRFEWKDPAGLGGSAGEQIGMIAQEVQAVFPEWVGETAEGVKFLSIKGFEALVVEALRSLAEKIEQLQTSPV